MTTSMNNEINLERMAALSVVNETGDNRTVEFTEGDDENDSDYEEEEPEEEQQQTSTRGSGGGTRGRGRGRIIQTTQAAPPPPPIIPPQKKRKLKGNKYVSIVSRKLKFLLTNISSFKAQNFSDEAIIKATTNEIKKLGNMEVHNLHGQLLKVNEEDSKDDTTSEAFSLITLNEPHIYQIVQECSKLDSHALKTRLSDIQKKIGALEEKLRALRESEILIYYFLNRLQNSAYAMKILKMCLYSVLTERITDD